MPDQVVCVANIGPRESRRRLFLGALLFAFTLAAGVAMVLWSAPRLWRLLLALPLWGAALSYTQVRKRTCVQLARRGQRNLDRGIEVVADPAVSAASRRQAQQVLVQATVTAVVATLLFLLVPAP